MPVIAALELTDMSPTISVVAPVYNRFELIKRVVESILAQTYPVAEIILIDDGSFDDTPEALPRHIAERPAWRERVRYFRQENQGQAAAFNNGIARAKGDWLAFSSDDDLWLPQKLEWQFRALEQFKNQCGMCFTDAWFMNNPSMKMTAFQLAGRQYNETIGMIPESIKCVIELDPVHSVHPVWVQTVVARADLVHRMGGFDTKLRYSEDNDFVFRLACETSFCFVGMPMVLVDRTPAMQRHVGAAKNWHKADYLLQMQQLRFEKCLRISAELSPAELSSDVRKFACRRLSAVHSGWANWYLENGEYGKARQAVTEAAKYALTSNIAMKWALTRIAPQLARKVMSKRSQNREQRSGGID
jgi:glycosyltransferase involved in cell wall biosynthesis